MHGLKIKIANFWSHGGVIFKVVTASIFVISRGKPLDHEIVKTQACLGWSTTSSSKTPLSIYRKRAGLRKLWGKKSQAGFCQFEWWTPFQWLILHFQILLQCSMPALFIDGFINLIFGMEKNVVFFHYRLGNKKRKCYSGNLAQF